MKYFIDVLIRLGFVLIIILPVQTQQSNSTNSIIPKASIGTGNSEMDFNNVLGEFVQKVNCPEYTCVQCLLNLISSEGSHSDILEPNNSLALMYFVLNPRTHCMEERCNRFPCYLNKIKNKLKNGWDNYSKNIKVNLKNPECVQFTRISVNNLSDEEVKRISFHIISSIIKGNCETSSTNFRLPSKSMQEIKKYFINKYGENFRISFKELELFLKDLTIGTTTSVSPEIILDSKILSRRKRHAREEDSSDKCYDTDTFFELYNSTGNQSAIHHQLQQQHHRITKICVNDPNENNNTSEATSDLKKYGYGTIAVTIISLCSLIGIFLFPFLKKNIYENLIAAFIALGVGTLTGDALIHLIPECVGGNEHSDENVASAESFHMALIIVFIIYLLFVFESIMNMISNKYNPRISDIDEHGHGHTHIPDVRYVRQMMAPQPTENGIEMSSVTNVSVASMSLSTSTLIPSKKNFCHGMTSLALVIILGDAIHNVADGLVIGAAFAANEKLGLSTSIAILCHEIPHELADFAVLLSTGMSIKKAAFYNFLGACTSYIGLYIGCSLGEDPRAEKIIFAIAAGMFLYVSLGDLMMELIHPKNGFKWLTFVGENIGMLIGIGIMVIIAVYENDI